MIPAAAGLHCGFGDFLGPETLTQVREERLTIPRITANRPDATQHHAANMASPERCRDLAQEVVDAGLQPFLSVVRAEQVALVHPGTLIEAGNEPDIEKFGWSKATYRSEFLRIIEACDRRGLKCYGPAISNLHKRGFDFLQSIPWSAIPLHVGCSFHWYPHGHSPTIGHDGRTREEEVAKLRSIVGQGRPLAVTEIGYHQLEWDEQETADNMAWERRFWSGQDIEVVVMFQINDGAAEDRSTDSHFGARDHTGRWKPAVRAFVDALNF